MSSQPLSQHEIYADQADEYLDEVSRAESSTAVVKQMHVFFCLSDRFAHPSVRFCSSLCLQHNIYEMMSGMLRKLVIHKPKDPLAFMMAALQQPVQQVGRTAQTNRESIRQQLHAPT